MCYKNNKIFNYVIKNNPSTTTSDMEKSNLVYQLTCPFHPSNNIDHKYIGMTTTK